MSSFGSARVRAARPTRMLLCTAALLVCGHVARAQPAASESADDAVGFEDSADFARPAAPAAASGEGSDDAVGFADSAAPIQPASSRPAPASAAESEPSPFTLGATLGWHTALRLETDRPSRLAALRQIVAAHVEFSHSWSGGIHFVARVAGRSEVDFEYLGNAAAYDAASYEVYAWQARPGESYLGIDTSVFALQVGEQTINYGQGEMFSVLDIVNPRDLREPLLTDASELRLPVLMTRASLSLDPIRTEVLVVHEPYFGLAAPPLGEFSPFRKLLLSNASLGAALGNRVLRNRHIPERDLLDFGATQAHFRMTWTGPGLDLTLSAGSVLDPLGVPSLPPAQAFDQPTIDLPIHHPRYTTFGHSGAWVLGAFVLRWEAAFDLSHSTAVRETGGSLLSFGTLRRHQLHGLLSLLYAPSTTTSASLEVAQSYVFDNPERQPGQTNALLFPIEATRVGLRVTQTFLRDRGSLNLVGMRFGAVLLNAWAVRLEVGYKLLDALELSVGAVTYQPTPEFGFFYGFEHNDRVFVNLRWML